VRPSVVIEPTAAPYVQFTLKPSVLPVFSVKPTVQPTKKNQGPNDGSPPGLPIALQASQNVDKITAAMYHADRAAYNRTFQSAIAGAMTGVISDQVTNITVTSIPSTSRAVHPHMRGYLDAVSGCVVRYQIRVEEAGEAVTFESLTAELEAAARSGRMNQLLQYFATLYNTTALQNCSMGVPITINLRPEVWASSAAPTAAPTLLTDVSVTSYKLSTGAVVGIVLGGICVLGVIAYIVYYRRTMRGKKYIPNDSQVVPVSEGIEDVMVTV